MVHDPEAGPGPTHFLRGSPCLDSFPRRGFGNGSQVKPPLVFVALSVVSSALHRLGPLSLRVLICPKSHLLAQGSGLNLWLLKLFLLDSFTRLWSSSVGFVLV